MFIFTKAIILYKSYYMPKLKKRTKEPLVQKKRRCDYCQKIDRNTIRLKLHEEKCKIGEKYIDESKKYGILSE